MIPKRVLCLYNALEGSNGKVHKEEPPSTLAGGWHVEDVADSASVERSPSTRQVSVREGLSISGCGVPVGGPVLSRLTTLSIVGAPTGLASIVSANHQD